MKKPYKISEINFDEILYSDPIVKNNKTNVLLKYLDNKHDLLVQTPELICIDKPKLRNNIYEINIALNSNSSKIYEFINFLNNLDRKVQSLCEMNLNWFSSSNKSYYKIIRSNNKYKNGFIKLKIKNNNYLNLLKVTKNKQTEISHLDNIEANNKIKLILGIYGIWIKSGKNNTNFYGVYLKPILIDYIVSEQISFIEDSDSENNNEVLDTEINCEYPEHVINNFEPKDNQSEKKLSTTEYNNENGMENNYFEEVIDKNITQNNSEVVKQVKIDVEENVSSEEVIDNNLTQNNSEAVEQVKIGDEVNESSEVVFDNNADIKKNDSEDVVEYKQIDIIANVSNKDVVDNNTDITSNYSEDVVDNNIDITLKTSENLSNHLQTDNDTNTSIDNLVDHLKVSDIINNNSEAKEVVVKENLDSESIHKKINIINEESECSSDASKKFNLQLI